MLLLLPFLLHPEALLNLGLKLGFHPGVDGAKVLPHVLRTPAVQGRGLRLDKGLQLLQLVHHGTHLVGDWLVRLRVGLVGGGRWFCF